MEKPRLSANLGAEFLGTFGLVFGGCGAAVLAAQFQSPDQVWLFVLAPILGAVIAGARYAVITGADHGVVIDVGIGRNPAVKMMEQDHSRRRRTTRSPELMSTSSPDTHTDPAINHASASMSAWSTGSSATQPAGSDSMRIRRRPRLCQPKFSTRSWTRCGGIRKPAKKTSRLLP